MALIPDGQYVETEIGENRSGKDMDGNAIVVSGSHESIKDYGWRTVWGAGETKYARGSYEQMGDTRLIRVTTQDCVEEDS